MKRHIVRGERQSPTSAAFSVAVHVVLAFVLATVTWYYPLGDFFSPKHVDAVPEEIRYIAVAPPAAVGNGSREGATARRGELPAPFVAPSAVPTTLPPIVPDAPGAGAISGVAGGTGDRPAGLATGVEPAFSDPRIQPGAQPHGRVPLSQARRADSAIAAIYGLYRDSIIAARLNAGRDPGDWTFERDGKTWGWDQRGVHLGGITIPNAVFAFLPVAPQGRNVNAVTDGRLNSWTRTDLQMNANRLSQDEFKEAVKRIRARVDRERAQQGKGSGSSSPP